MSRLGRNRLVAAAVAVGLFGAIHFSVRVHLISVMTKKGNRTLVEGAATALSRYYAEAQQWPIGTATEIAYAISGRRGIDAATGNLDGEDSRTVAVADVIPMTNYLRGLPMRTDGQNLMDAWDTPLRFELPEHQNGRVVSAGPDRKFDTRDDTQATAAVGARFVRPARIDLERAEAIARQREAHQAMRHIR